MFEFLNQTYFHNTVKDYLIALFIILIGASLVSVFKKKLLLRVRAWSGRTDNNFDDFLVDALNRFGIPALYFAIIYIGVNYLTISPKGETVLKNATTVVITFLFIRLVSSVILFVLSSFIRKQERGEEKVQQLGGLMIIINVVIWILGFLFLFENMGYDVTAMITGLGIGGIAVALAAQNILGDLFNYFVIFLDRPFEINDFIIIEDKMGTVEHIGIKTTRLKSLSGEQLIFSNSDLTNSRIHNYKRMERRRIVFNVNVVYDATAEQLKEIPQILRSAVEAQSPILFDRAHFRSLDDWALNFEVVYMVLSSEYNVYMDIQQAINIRIFEEFNKRGIGFAFPTNTTYLRKEGQQQMLPE